MSSQITCTWLSLCHKNKLCVLILLMYHCHASVHFNNIAITKSLLRFFMQIKLLRNVKINYEIQDYDFIINAVYTA